MATSTARQAVSKLGQMGRQSSPSRVMPPSQNKHSPLPTPRSPPPIQEVTIPPVFDIFEVPVRLKRERDASPSSRRQPPSFTSTPQSIHTTRDQTHSSLPRPMIFDGPSRPPSMLKDSREGQVKGPRSPLQADQKASTVQVFNGPSRPHRRDGRPAEPNPKLVAGTLAIGAVTGAGAIISAQ